MADAGNMSVSRAMGEWLSDTADAAEMIVLKMEEAKKAPMRVMREMQAMIAGMSDQVELDIVQVRKLVAGGSGDALARTARPSTAAVPPPSSNTGGKSPTRAKGKA